jgi:hypothetical protein
MAHPRGGLPKADPADPRVGEYVRRLADVSEADKADRVVDIEWTKGAVPPEVRDRYPTSARLLEAVYSELRWRVQLRHLALLRQSVSAGDSPFPAPPPAGPA